MTKRELVKWLEAKQQETIKNAEQQYEEAVKIHKEQLYKKLELEKVSSEIEEHLNAAYNLYRTWKQKHQDDVEIRDFYRSGIGGNLASMVNSNGGIFSIMIDRDILDNTTDMESMRRRMCETRSEINRNYENLIMNVKSIKNSKLVCDYLKEIGFDISNIEVKTDTCTALTVEIDTRFLFVKATDAT